MRSGKKALDVCQALSIAHDKGNPRVTHAKTAVLVWVYYNAPSSLPEIASYLQRSSKRTQEVTKTLERKSRYHPEPWIKKLGERGSYVYVCTEAGAAFCRAVLDIAEPEAYVEGK